jgi:hypothetical protein
VVLIADWYDEAVLVREKYSDDNTRSTWFPVTGGSNVPGINNFLRYFGGQIGMQSFKGKISFDGMEVRYSQGMKCCTERHSA